MAGRIEISWAETEVAYSGAVRKLRPDADVLDGNWTTDQGGADLHSAVDEGTVNDTDYIQSGINPSEDVARIALSNPGGTVDTTQPVTIRYRYAKTGPNTMNIQARLKEGVNTIAEWTHENIGAGWVTAAQVLTGPEKAAVTDWNNLEIEIEANPAEIVLVSQITHEIPGYTDDEPLALPASLQEGDIVLLFHGNDNTVDFTNINAADNWIGIERWSSDTYFGACVSYKIMGQTPDTTVRVSSNNARGESKVSKVFMQAFRGVDTANPFDATPTEQELGYDPVDNPADPPPITTVTDGAWVVVFGAINDRTNLLGGPTGYTNGISEATFPSSGGSSTTMRMASKKMSTAGFEDPAAFSGVIGRRYWALSVALRPA